ncbi:P-loop containing nucleoside triphosphate hydrolase protein [Pelagophyceae sp. CCMP2097]|nr:P-loop containing nucleoside triphosphate hydrolase protein [Pelagophyceae sp. CCMP2097]
MAAEMREKLARRGISKAACECLTFDAAVLRGFEEHGDLYGLFSDGNWLPAAAVRRLLGLVDETHFKGTIVAHTKKFLDVFMASCDDDVKHASDDKFYGVRLWWQKHGMRMPDFQNYARRLWRAVIALGDRPADLLLSHGAISKAAELASRLVGGATNAAALDWMLRGQLGGTLVERFSSSSTIDLVGNDVRFLVVDEAQDMNSPHFELFVLAPRRRGKVLATVLVGDSRQALYGWRGARNSLLDAAPYATHDLELTISFRFGPPLARLLTHVLQTAKAPLDAAGDPAVVTPVIGRGGPTALYLRNDVDCHDYTQCPLAVVGRTNKGILSAADEYARRAPAGAAPFLFVCGAALNDQRALVERLVALRDGGGEARFGEESGTFAHLRALQAENAIEDKALITALALVSAHAGNEALQLIDRLRALSTERAQDARVHLVTVHKFKGLEERAVRLLDDFDKGPGVELFDAETGKPACGLRDSIVCLIYTAASRAVEHLYLNTDLARLWLYHHPQRPVLRCAADDAAAEALPRGFCACCGAERRLLEAGARARAAGFEVVSSHAAPTSVCESCAQLRALQPPLAFADTDQVVAGWRLAPDPAPQPAPQPA